MSTFTDLCDHVMEELQSNIAELSTGFVHQHKYTPMSVEALVPDGDRHLAVWPVGDLQAETREPLAIGVSNIQHRLLIMYWEPSEEGDDLLADEHGAAQLLELAEKCRDIFLSHRVRSDPPAWLIEWSGVVFGAGGGQDSGLVRWFIAELVANVAVSHTA